MNELTPEQAERRRGGRQLEVPKAIPLVGGVALRLAEQIRLDESLSEAEKMELYRTLPRNRAEARRLLRGRGPWGVAKRHG